MISPINFFSSLSNFLSSCPALPQEATISENPHRSSFLAYLKERKVHSNDPEAPLKEMFFENIKSKLAEGGVKMPCTSFNICWPFFRKLLSQLKISTKDQFINQIEKEIVFGKALQQACDRGDRAWMNKHLKLGEIEETQTPRNGVLKPYFQVTPQGSPLYKTTQSLMISFLKNLSGPESFLNQETANILDTDDAKNIVEYYLNNIDPSPLNFTNKNSIQELNEKIEHLFLGIKQSGLTKLFIDNILNINREVIEIKSKQFQQKEDLNTSFLTCMEEIYSIEKERRRAVLQYIEETTLPLQEHSERYTLNKEEQTHHTSLLESSLLDQYKILQRKFVQFNEPMVSLLETIERFKIDSVVMRSFDFLTAMNRLIREKQEKNISLESTRKLELQEKKDQELEQRGCILKRIKKNNERKNVFGTILQQKERYLLEPFLPNTIREQLSKDHLIKLEMNRRNNLVQDHNENIQQTLMQLETNTRINLEFQLSQKHLNSIVQSHAPYSHQPWVYSVKPLS